MTGISDTVLSSLQEIIKKGKLQHGKETFYKKRTPVDSKIDIHESIESQFNLLRTVDNINYPAFFFNKGKRFIIKIYKED